MISGSSEGVRELSKHVSVPPSAREQPEARAITRTLGPGAVDPTWSTKESNCHRLNSALHPSEDVTRRGRFSRDEERATAAVIARGDQAARNLMVQAYLGLVVTIAREFQGRGLVLDDLIGEGNLGLIRATADFDPDFETPFATYATYWVKQAIRDALINTTATIRLPSHMVRLLTRWRRAEGMLRRETHRMPDFEEVASVLGLSERQKSLVRKARQAGKCKFEGGRGGGEANQLLDEATDRHAPVERLLQADDERDSLMRRMESLDGLERAVLTFRFGLGGEALTRREIGTRLGVRADWVRRIESGAIRKLGGGESR
jgi:RNA polymerase primary sigma factor